jgi:outer membrane lipoprotein SlyB
MTFRSVIISALAIGSLIPAAAISSEGAVYRSGERHAQTTQVVVRQQRRRVRRRTHTKRNSALRIGGGAAAGAGIGALVGGGKGAAIGAIAGGGAGTVYDQHERHKGR